MRRCTLPPSVNESGRRRTHECLVHLVVPSFVAYANQNPLPGQRLLAGIGKETDPWDLLGFQSRLGRGRTAHDVPPELRVNEDGPVPAVEFDACPLEELTDGGHIQSLARPVHLNDEARDRLGLIHRLTCGFSDQPIHMRKFASPLMRIVWSAENRVKVSP